MAATSAAFLKPANHKEERRDRCLAKNQNGKRQVVVVMRERDGRTLPAVFKSESAALGFIASRVAPETRLMADEASSWNDLHAKFDVRRIDHDSLYSDQNGVNTNGAEEFFSRPVSRGKRPTPSHQRSVSRILCRRDGVPGG